MRTEKTYPFILTSYSECMKGVFKNNLPPETMEDVLMEIQAISCYEKDDMIHGTILIVIAREDFSTEPFDIQFYAEKRNPPYRTIGYRAVRALKNVRLKDTVSKDNTDYHDKFIEFTAEVDTGWEQMDYTYEEYRGK
jgi:hypothetical protein